MRFVIPEFSAAWRVFCARLAALNVRDLFLLRTGLCQRNVVPGQAPHKQRSMLSGITAGIIFLSTPALSAESFCNFLEGAWFGSYTFLDGNCHKHNGCMHLMDAGIKRLAAYDPHFQAVLTLQMGQTVIVSFTCENNTLNFPEYPNSASQFSCANGACMIKYQDSKLSSTVIHVISQNANNRI